MKVTIELNELSLQERMNLAAMTKNIELLTALAEDPHHLVRVSVAHNKATPDEVREKLASDSNECVRETVECYKKIWSKS